MRSLNDIKYKGVFTSNSGSWSSLTVGFDDLHKIYHKGKYVYFNGYDFYDEDGDFHSYYNNDTKPHKSGDKFKLISVVCNSEGKNYLGKCTNTGKLITFEERQITLLRYNNEKF